MRGIFGAMNTATSVGFGLYGSFPFGQALLGYGRLVEVAMSKANEQKMAISSRNQKQQWSKIGI